MKHCSQTCMLEALRRSQNGIRDSENSEAKLAASLLSMAISSERSPQNGLPGGSLHIFINYYTYFGADIGIIDIRLINLSEINLRFVHYFWNPLLARRLC